ncbi:unnamed protein product [Caenorhabditis auriculariae]|uniref:Uncharacterized protein n=1 Tax=Caenorhabditis auriculariae TaxID=2777116 RepID=A0A8S1GNJ4_9PELO|nr:unnamed protein product [Caenorhabditis auriculariae]
MQQTFNWVEKTVLGSVISHISVHENNELLACCSGHSCDFYNGKGTKVSLAHDSLLIASFFVEEKILITVTENGDVSEWQLEENEDEEGPAKISSRKVTAFPVSAAFLVDRPKKTGRKFEIWLVIQRGEDSEVADLCYICPDSSIEKVVEVPAEIRAEQIAIHGEMLAYCQGNQVFAQTCFEEKPKKSSFIYESRAERIGLGDGKHLNEFIRASAVDNFLAVTMANGRIYLWSNFQTSGVSDQAHTFHWHKVAPQLELTPFGNIVSAGAECTLVRSTKGAKPTFLPRLVAPVIRLKLSPDASRVVLLMEDNSLHVILLSSMALERTIPTFCYCERSLNTIFKSDPGSIKKWIMSAKPGFVQWVDSLGWIQSANMNVTLDNAVDGDMSLVGVRVAYKDVLEMALSVGFAATLEKFINFDSLNQLRFWRRKAGRFEFVSAAMVPTDFVFLAACKASSSEFVKTFITASQSGKIHVYEFSNDENNAKEDVTRARNWQESPIEAISSISADGKWISAHSQNLVLWDVKTMRVIDSLCCDDQVTFVDFESSGRYAIIATESNVFCWDTMSLAVLWRIQQKVGVCLESSGSFVFIGSQVMQFDPLSGRVLNTWKFSADIIQLGVVKRDHYRFIAKTSKGILALRAPEKTNTSKEEPIERETPFQRLGNRKVESVVVTDTAILVQPKPDASKIFAGPCHSLPPLTLLAPLFIEKALLPPPPQKVVS